MEDRGHKILNVRPDSIAWEYGVEPGMYVVAVNGQEIGDIFDYQYLMTDTHVDVLIREEDGEETLVSADKEEDEDFGVTFENPLMDDYRSCSNHCIFCFIDQMPKGMRKTLYFKDDDSRLSFLQGNYVTLTNLSEHDIDRIIRYRMEPINISVQTMNPSLRVKMLHNRTAGTALKKMDLLKKAGISMNGQIVLCRGWNDGDELEFTIRNLTRYLPEMQSVSVVPVGLSRFRGGLTPLEPFTAEDASRVIDLIEAWQKKIWNRLAASYKPEDPDEWELSDGAPRHFIHASDEWYLLAGRSLPEAARYDGFLQYENGVGMLRMLLDETDEAIRKYREMPGIRKNRGAHAFRAVSVTGRLPYPFIRGIMEKISREFPWSHVEVLPIRNDFFGESITVTGLITGQDLTAQLGEYRENGGDPGEAILIPVNMLRRGEEVFLDDMTLDDVRKQFGLPVRVVRDSGEDLVRAALGLEPLEEKVERQLYEQTDCSDCGTAECGKVHPV